MGKLFKREIGITLIALVITIIVLLILAGVTIVTLTGDNGLLQKAQNAGEQSKTAETEEQIKLIYAEYQISKYAEGNTSAGEYLKEELEKTYGEGNVDIISQEESIVLKVTNNGESKFYEYTPSTGISKELQKGINYNGKQPSEIVPGDDITIVTEKFKVFAVENSTIKAMPYYNITLTDTPVQSKNTGKTTFSTRTYWSRDEDGNEISGWNNVSKDNIVNIDSNNEANNIQKYISSYKTTLNGLGAKQINVKLGNYSELTVSGVTPTMRNPGQIGSFWISSVRLNNSGYVLVVGNDGGFIGNNIFANLIGVRPIMEIPIE